MQAMIFAAGLGTRLRPLTNEIPKALVQIKEQTLLEIVLERLLFFGIKDVVINVHHFADIMTDYIISLSTKLNCNLIISNEKDMLLDTGGGLLKARHYFSATEPILLHNVDILSDLDLNNMLQTYNKLNQPLALLAVSERKTQRYLIFNEINQLSGWTNIATKQRIITNSCKSQQLLAFSGIQIINPAIFDKVELRGKFSLIDMYLQLSRNNVIKSYLHKGKWLDVGKIESLSVAEKTFFN